jgi:hypothetical protein
VLFENTLAIGRLPFCGWATTNALEAASTHGYDSTVELLIDTGALEACGINFRTIGAAAMHGHLIIVKSYLDYFARLQHDDCDGRVLHKTAAFSPFEIVELLLNAAFVTIRSTGDKLASPAARTTLAAKTASSGTTPYLTDWKSR